MTDILVKRPNGTWLPISGKDGADGKDAVANTEDIVARVAEVAVSRVAALIPTPAKGEKGDPGPRGADGLSSIEEIRALAQEEARKEVLMQQRSFYKGVFREGNYRTADAVTWDGSVWFAARNTTVKPGTDDSWILAVKRGRDAKK